MSSLQIMIVNPISRSLYEGLYRLISGKLEREQVNEIHLTLFSDGGSFKWAKEIYRYLRMLSDDLGVSVHTYAFMNLEGTANYVFLAGDVRHATPGSSVTFTPLTSGDRLTARQLLEGMKFDFFPEVLRPAMNAAVSTIREKEKWAKEMIKARCPLVSEEQLDLWMSERVRLEGAEGVDVGIFHDITLLRNELKDSGIILQNLWVGHDEEDVEELI